MRFLAAGLFRRKQEAERIESLRARDGERCARCRRALRFDLPAGHDQGPVIEGGSGADRLAAARLCHRRCTAGGFDHTDQVAERMRRKAEAALFAKSRRKRRAA